jgi:hypothetical protein
VSKTTKLEASRELIKDAFSLYTPIFNDVHVQTVKGSRCLVSPWAFDHKKVVQFVNAHKNSEWLLYCYTERKDAALFKAVAFNVWRLVKPKIRAQAPKKMKIIGLLIIPALADSKHFCLTGKRQFSVREICKLIGIDEKNNHWHRDYKESWNIIVNEIMSLDSSSLHDLDKHIFN